MHCFCLHQHILLVDEFFFLIMSIIENLSFSSIYFNLPVLYARKLKLLKMFVVQIFVTVLTDNLF